MRDQQPQSTITIEDVKKLARELAVKFTDGTVEGWFDLDKQEPLRLEGTYRSDNQAGINEAYGALVRYKENLRKIRTS